MVPSKLTPVRSLPGKSAVGAEVRFVLTGVTLLSLPTPSSPTCQVTGEFGCLER